VLDIAISPNFMEFSIFPHVKNKCGDITDIDNYRTIAVSNAEIKIFESVILGHINDDVECDMYNFSFKKKHSTWLCTSAVKRTIDYYLERGSYVFASSSSSFYLFIKTIS